MQAFVERRPWAAAFVSLVFAPFIGMLYLGRGRLALLYLALELALNALLIAFVVPIRMGGDVSLNMFLLTSPLRLIGAVHGFALARRRAADEGLPTYSRWYWLVAIVLGFYAAAFVIRTFFFQPFDIRSASMSPALNQGDYIFVSHRAFDSREPGRGDVVVFHAPDGDFVKRIVGVPGDRVQMIAGRLVLNGKPLPVRRVEDFAGSDALGAAHPIPQYVETLPSGRRYRILDEQQGSALDDTRLFLVPDGHYFVLGDNRDNSDDSRLDVGFVARRDIAGLVAVTWADRTHKTAIFQRVD